MTINDVINNLTRTIRGKTKLLSIIEADVNQARDVEYIKINLDELNRIKADLEKVRDSLPKA
jgi:hypothetical protein